MTGTRTVTGPGWRLTVPATLSSWAGSPAPDGDATSVSIVRGWLGEAPLELVVSTVPRRGTTLRRRVRELTEWFEHADKADGVELPVRGAHGARRAAGEIVLDDDHARERIVAVVAAGRRELVVAVARSSFDDDAWQTIDTILDSLELDDGAPEP